jgi:hypothetical protein
LPLTSGKLRSGRDAGPGDPEVAVRNPWLAFPRGADLASVSRDLHTAYETFLATGVPDQPIRQVVLDSWRRSVRSGVDPEDPLLEAPTDGTLRDYRATHPLAAVMPIVQRLLVSDAAESGLLVAVADADGRLLWVDGETRQLSRAADIGFTEGAVWSEERAGTNAPGTAIAVDHAVQIYAGEHFSHPVQRWSCSAAPVHDPVTGEVLGAIDVTGGDEAADPHTLSLVRATAAAAESELRLRALLHAAAAPGRKGRPGKARLIRSAPVPAPGGARLLVMARTGGGRLIRTDAPDLELSLRHTELLLVLARHPAGLTAEQLALASSEQETAPVTVRAEMSRLRRLLGPELLASRPYRLTRPLGIDVDQVGRLLDRGAHRQALAGYGPVLVRSTAPFVRALRDETRLRLRESLLRHATVDVLLRYAASPDGLQDAEVWAACLSRLPPGSPRRDGVRTHLDGLRRELGG